MSEARIHHDEPTIPFEDLPARMKRARHRMGWEQAEMANRLGVHQRTIANYETGKTEPKLALLMSWASLTNVPLDWLTFGITPEVKCPHCDRAMLPPQQDRRGADTRSRCFSEDAQASDQTVDTKLEGIVFYPSFDAPRKRTVVTDGEATILSLPASPA